MKPELVFQNWPLFLEGLWTTVHLTALALAVGLCIAVPAAFLRLNRVPVLSPLVDGYVALFRGTPLLVQLYMVYYGLSQFDWIRDTWAWILLREAWWCALITFALNSGAYATEILRGAIAAAPRGELEAAKALGLRPRQVDRLILLPGALRRALPQLGNETVFMLHGSAVASVITIQDILGAGRHLNARFYLAYEGLLTAAILYMLVTLVVVTAFRALERRYLRHLRMDSAPRTRELPAMR